MGVIFRNMNKESFNFENEKYNPMSDKSEENDNKIYLDIPAEFPGPDLEKDTKNEAIVEP